MGLISPLSTPLEGDCEKDRGALTRTVSCFTGWEMLLSGFSAFPAAAWRDSVLVLLQETGEHSCEEHSF